MEADTIGELGGRVPGDSPALTMPMGWVARTCVCLLEHGSVLHGQLLTDSVLIDAAPFPRSLLGPCKGRVTHVVGARVRGWHGGTRLCTCLAEVAVWVHLRNQGHFHLPPHGPTATMNPQLS